MRTCLKPRCNRKPKRQEKFPVSTQITGAQENWHHFTPEIKQEVTLPTSKHSQKKKKKKPFFPMPEKGSIGQELYHSKVITLSPA